MKKARRAEQKLLMETIKKHSEGPNVVTIDKLVELTGKSRSTVLRTKKKMNEVGMINIAGKHTGVSIPKFLYNKVLFNQLPIVNDFIEKCEIDKKNPSRYLMPLFHICRTLNIHPQVLIEGTTKSERKKTAEKMFSDFERKWALIKPNKTTERYSKSLRKFCYYNDTDLKGSTAIPGGSESKGDYAMVHLSDMEVAKGFVFLEKAGVELAILFALFHEFFPRPDALFSWIPQFESQYVDVDGKSYEYGKLSIYEPKQEKYFDKLILDPKVLALIKELDPNRPLVPKAERGDAEHALSVALRQFYTSIGKIEEGVEYPKGQPGWLYTVRPIYTTRHSSATMWTRRLNYNIAQVASMGWEDPKTLTQYYARVTTDSIMQSGICYYCKPPMQQTDKLSFCCASHCVAYLNGARK